MRTSLRACAAVSHFGTLTVTNIVMRFLPDFAIRVLPLVVSMSRPYRKSFPYVNG